MGMVIAIDGYEANIKNRVGIGRFAYELIVGLEKEEKKKHTKDRFFIFLPETPRSDLPAETPWWQYRIIPSTFLWTYIGLPIGLGLQNPRPDVVLSPTHYAPRFSSIPRVICVMDLSYLYFPELFRRKDLYQLTQWSRLSILHAHTVLTISKYTKFDIMSRYNIGKDRIEVIYPGYSMSTSGKKSFEDIVRTYSLSPSYILSVGTLQPRKNYVRLIEAFKIFRETDKKWEETMLVIVGKRGWLYEEILRAPEKFHLEGKVRFLEFIPDQDLAMLYRHAEAFVMPSLYEGFGLPVLEAMAHQCTVVVSRVSSLPEIAGEAAVYVDPIQVESIANGMLKAIVEKGSLNGKRRIEIGLNQVKKFTWQNAAKKTLEVLHAVAH